MLAFRFGRAGRFIPLITAAAFILVAALNESDVSGYTLAFFLSIIIGSIVSSDRKSFGKAALGGLCNPMFGTVSIAIILASIAGKLVSGSGMIDALVAILLHLDVTSGLFVSLSFLLCCVLSMSTGTSVGTYIIAIPVFFPIGLELGADPLVMIGAIASGGLFGDNLAPISDTTIASATTQHAEMSDVVRTRCRYSIPVALLCFIAFILLGSKGSVQHEAVAMVNNPLSLAMLLVPASVIFLCLRKVDLIASLSIGIAIGSIAGPILGIFSFSDLISYPGGFSVSGLYIDAINGSSSTVFMLIGAFMFLGILDEAEIIKEIGRGLSFLARGRRSAELSIMLAIGIGGALTGVCTVSMVALGPVVHSIGEKMGIRNERCANLMDCGGLSLTAVAPWTVHAVLPASLAMIAVPSAVIAPMDVVLHNLYPLFMMPLMLFTIAFGGKENMKNS